MEPEPPWFEECLFFIELLLNFWRQEALRFALNDVPGRVHLQLGQNVGDSTLWATYLLKKKGCDLTRRASPFR